MFYKHRERQESCCWSLRQQRVLLQRICYGWNLSGAGIICNTRASHPRGAPSTKLPLQRLLRLINNAVIQGGQRELGVLWAQQSPPLCPCRAFGVAAVDKSFPGSLELPAQHHPQPHLCSPAEAECSQTLWVTIPSILDGEFGLYKQETFRGITKMPRQ